MAKKFQQLIDTGGRQIATNTSSTELLLGPDTKPETTTNSNDNSDNTAPATGATTRSGEPAEHPDRGAADGTGRTIEPPSGHQQTNRPANVETVETPTETSVDTTGRAHPDTPARKRRSAETRPGKTGGIAHVLTLLPPPENVLLTGIEPSQPVRDLTYEIPETLYLEFRKMKHLLSKHAGRRITNPALCETALALLPTSSSDLYRELDRLQHVIGLGDSRTQRRRLTARVAEQRYEQLHDSHLELLLAGHGDIPISAIWSLALALLHEALETAGN